MRMEGSSRIAVALPQGRLFAGAVRLVARIGVAGVEPPAERIVDLVDSGRTLRENGLVEVEEAGR